MIKQQRQSLHIDCDYYMSDGNISRIVNDTNTYYWFNGIKSTLRIIADMANMPMKYIKRNAKNRNLTIQEYLKSIEYIKE